MTFFYNLQDFLFIEINPHAGLDDFRGFLQRSCAAVPERQLFLNNRGNDRIGIRPHMAVLKEIHHCGFVFVRDDDFNIIGLRKTGRVVLQRYIGNRNRLYAVTGVSDIIEISMHGYDEKDSRKPKKRMTKSERDQLIKELTKQMKQAAKLLDFELAAQLRDQIKVLEKQTAPKL